MKIELRDEVEGFLSENDMQFILLHMDLTNDSCEELELYPDDFLLSVDQGTAYIQELPFATGQFDEIFTLSPQQTISGYFLYVIPSKAKKICFIHPEYDGEEISKTYKLRYELV